MVLASEVKYRYLSPSLALSNCLPTWMQLGILKPSSQEESEGYGDAASLR